MVIDNRDKTVILNNIIYYFDTLICLLKLQPALKLRFIIIIINENKWMRKLFNKWMYRKYE